MVNLFWLLVCICASACCIALTAIIIVFAIECIEEYTVAKFHSTPLIKFDFVGNIKPQSLGTVTTH